MARFTIRILADAAADALGQHAGPVAMRLSAAGPPQPNPAGPPAALPDLRFEGIEPRPAAAAPAAADLVLERPGCVLLPALVNAHAHLDLSHLGPQAHNADDGFTAWIDRVRLGRRTDPPAIAEAVRRGVALSLAGGVAAVGDVDGGYRGRATLAAAEAVRTSPLSGTSFAEFFAIGPNSETGWSGAALLFASASPAFGGRLGLSPHAPYTVAPPIFAKAAATAGVRLMTHLAESPEEVRFVRHGDGPMRAFLDSLGLWTDALRTQGIGVGLHPTDLLARALVAAPGRWAVVHMNDAPDRAIALLACTRTSVVYCPRASAAFAAPRHFGVHRYREMLAAGVNVALGTDSILTLDTPDRISPLDDARLLWRRDGVDARTLLAMCTTRAAAAIGWPEERSRFVAGRQLGGVIAVPTAGAAGNPLELVMKSEAGPEFLLVGDSSC